MFNLPYKGSQCLTILAYWPRYANNLQPWPLATLREWPRYANNLKPLTLNFQPWPWPIGHATRMATLREQP